MDVLVGIDKNEKPRQPSRRGSGSPVRIGRSAKKYLILLFCISMGCLILISFLDKGTVNGSLESHRVYSASAATRRDSRTTDPILGHLNLSRQANHEIPGNPIMLQKYKEFLDTIKKINQNPVITKQTKSSYQCLGKQTDYKAVEGRSCRFKNLCYEKSSRSYLYFQPIREPVFYDADRGPLYSFDDDIPAFIRVNALPYGYVTTVTPKVRVGPLDLEKVHMVNELTVLWATWSWEINMGHFVYEELASAFVALHRFNINFAESPLLLDLMRPPDNANAKFLKEKFLSGFSKAITNKTVGYFASYIDNLKTISDLVCFKDVIVSSSNPAFISPERTDQFGREEIWFEFRNKVLLSHSINPYKKPDFEQILLLRKNSSQTKSDVARTHYRDIYNYDEVIEHIKLQYPAVKFIVTDPSKLSIAEQLELTMNSTILITPPGGISMLIPFLPIDSTAIIMDYYSPEDDSLISSRKGESVSMEISLWNVFPHIKKMYYQIMDPQKDIIKDFEGAKLTREDYSVIVDMDRLTFMINSALNKN
jgi:Glycosyltransferase 61